MSHFIRKTKIQRYHQPPAGNTEKYITLKPVKISGGLISSYNCLKDYHIHEFGKGFKAAESILHHIVTNKLNRSFQKNDLWHKTVVVQLECEIFATKNRSTFAELKPATVEDIHPEFAATEGRNRLADIYTYAERFSRREDITPPLYVTGAVLNEVGANIDPKMIFMMDGARRIAAAALRHSSTINVYLLMCEVEYAQLIKETHHQRLAEQIRQIQWFDSYQTIPLVGMQGQRSLKRFDLIDMSALQDHTVMDFGCNLGQTCIKAVQAGAKEVIGVEGMQDTYSVANQIGKTLGFSNLHYLNVDFNDVHFDRQIDEYYPRKVDYSFFLSVYRTKELTQREKLFQYIVNKTNRGIFFEGHAHSKIDTIEYYDWLFNCFKLKYKFLGYSEGNLRPLFFCPIESHPFYQQMTLRTTETTADDQKGIAGEENYMVSAIVSTYESEKFIEGKIQDLLNQTIGEQLEIVVIDSHSPQNEKAIVTKYAQNHKNIKYIRTEKRESVYRAWNRGIREAQGKYITNANTDDRLKPDAFEILVDELNRTPDIALVYGDFFITHYENQDFYNHVCCGYSIKPDYSTEIMLSGCHMGPQPMWRKSIHDEIGYFDENFQSAGDYEFWCRLATKYSMKHINKFIGLYYHNPQGIVNRAQNKSNYETVLVKEKYKDKFPPHSGKPPTGYYFKDHVSRDSYVNICMVTYNRLDFTKQAIESIHKNTRYPHVITIVDNASQDGTQEFLSEIKREGIIKNLIFLDENIGVAKASNLAWQQEPNAAYYLKYDNDIVIQKQDWLMNMIKVVDSIPKLGAIGYNFEPTNYPAEDVNGCQIRIKRNANIGGACYLIPKRVENKLGYWCEDYGLYGEEDGDYSLRLRLAGYYNAYMVDENIGIHLPGGKAALIDSFSKRGISFQELEKEYEYRNWKDFRRQELQKPGGILQRNVGAYHKGIRSLYVPRGVFLGKLCSNVQVFEQNDFFSFLPVSSNIESTEQKQIKLWLEENKLDFFKIEKYNQNGREALRVRKTRSEPISDIKPRKPLDAPAASETVTSKLKSAPASQIMSSGTSSSVSIIIPVYNQCEYTQNCLNALYEVTDIQGGFEVIVVDNASADNTQPFLNEAKKKYPGLSFIRNQTNLGFAKACNQGAKLSQGYYLVFLNNDTLPQTGWLDEMIKTAEKNPLVGMVGSRLLYPDGTIQHAGVYFNEHGIPYHAFRSAPGDHTAVIVTRETPGVTGACMLMPKQLFQYIGGFNEDYQMYVEDVDLCLRTWDAGFKVVYCAESVLTHFESASITDVNRRDAQVREAWNHLQKCWRNKWPTVLQELTPEDTSRRIDINSDPKRNDNVQKQSKVLWHAPIFDPSGYADEARNFILQLSKQNIHPTVREIGRRSDVFRDGLDEKSRTGLDVAIAQKTPEDFISLIQFPAYAFERIPQSRYHIGRTMFETDSLPVEWVKKCNLMDEVWVPSEFNMQTFKAAGVISKLFKVPAGVDSQRYRPGLDVLEIPGTRGVVFLSIFEWIYRKGWDVLLKSWAKAFHPGDDVSLVLRAYPLNATDGIGTKKEIEQRIDHFLEGELQISREEVAPIVVLADQLHDQDMPRLYASADAYVLPSRGEGWGRTQMEAMACGLPVLSTRWSGNLEFMTDHNSLLINVNGLAGIDESTEIPFYRGQKWAEPSVEHLSALMRKVVENPTGTREIGRRARLDIERYWRWERIAAIAAERLQAINTELEHHPVATCGSNRALKVRWEGSQFVHHSLALVNREVCIELARRQDIELSLIPYEPHVFGPEEDFERFSLIEERLQKPLSGAADFHVRHQWPPNFTPPPEGHWIMIQPWEFGALPQEWIEPLRSEVDEIWAYTTYVRNVYINSGIPSAKVHVIPLSINHDQFHPAALPLNLNTEKQFKFLFVGGTIKRKGIDVLLSAYAQAFSCADDVCLVIKDMGGESFYRGQNAAQMIKEIKKNPAAPEILYLTETLNKDQIAGLYTTCNCLVHPYRGEGFGLPVAEAMACGLPVIVTKGGACDDFCCDETAYLIDSKVRPVQMDDCELSAQGWLLEPDKAQLIDALRFVYEDPDQAKEKGTIAAGQIRKKMDWKISTDLIMERLKALKGKPVLRFAGSADSRAVQAMKTPQEFYDTIQQSMQHKRSEEVINELEMLAESYPQFALAHNDLGVLYYNAGGKEKAFACYEKAVKLDPDNIIFQKNLADFYYVELGKVEDALRIYVKILEANPEDVETLLITGHICVALEKFQDAEVFYSRVLEIEPGHQDARQFRHKLNSMITANSGAKTPEELYQEIQPLLNNGDPHKAITELERLLENFPDFALAHNDLGVINYHIGNKEMAQHHYERAVKLMPENISFQKNLADFYCIELGRVEDALKIYVSILTAHPQDIEVLMATGQICIAMEQLNDARVFFKHILEIEPWNEAACHYLEELERQPSTAALVNAESPAEIYQGLTQSLSAVTQEEAICEFEKLVRSYPDFALGHNDLGVLNYQVGNKENALYHYQRAAQLEPENITFQKNLADFVFVELKNAEEALHIYQKIINAKPNDVETLLITGHICVALKRLDEAKDYYERVLALEPGNDDARNNLDAIITHLATLTSSPPESLDSSWVVKKECGLESLGLNESKHENRGQTETTSIIISLDGIQNRLKECIKSIQKQTPEPHEVIFLNNGATKGALNWAQRLVNQKPDYQLIDCGKNVTWAESHNQAVRSASGEFIVIMHNDVMVPEGWLSALKTCIGSMPNIGLVGPMFNHVEGIQQNSCAAECSSTDIDFYAGVFYQQNQYRRVPTRKLAPTCLMFRSELIQNIGGLNQQFDSENVVIEDFCNHSVSQGYQNLIAADVVVYHYNRHKVKKHISPGSMTVAKDRKRFRQYWNGLVAENSEAHAFQTVNLLHTADELSQKGKIDQAVETLLSGIGAHPEDRRFYLALAEILIAAKRFEDAKDALNEIPIDENVNMQTEEQIVGQKGHNSANGFSNVSSTEDLAIKKNELIGYAEEGLENYEMAHSYIDRVLSMKPNSACALNLKGILAYRESDKNTAERLFKQAIESDPGYGESYTNLGMLKLEADRLEDALPLFEKGFILAPADLDIAMNYHSVVSGVGDYKKAESFAREAADLYPNNQKITYMLIDFLVQQGKYTEAMVEIEAAIVKFGLEDDILSAALQVREKLGPVRIKKDQKRSAVSLCMIVKDEENYLAKCLASVKPIVDEMIVVDTGSTDRTKKIATAFGAKIYDFVWSNDFSEARNFSITKAEGGWIFVLDADEVVSSLDYQKFRKIVNKPPKAPVAYSITTRNYNTLPNMVGWIPNDGKYPKEEAASGWLPSMKVRLFHDKDMIWFEGAVHEMVDPVLKRNGVKIKQCSIPIHHYGRLDSEHVNRKGEVYFDIGKKKLDEMGDDANAIRELAVQATNLGKNEDALELWQRLLSLKPFPRLAAETYINMGTIYNRLEKFQDALAVSKKAVENAPELKEALYNYAMAELHSGSPHETIKVLEELLTRMPDYPPARFILTAAYCCTGHKEKSLNGLNELQGTSWGPVLGLSCAELAKGLLSAQRVEYALMIISTAIECDIVNTEIMNLFAKCVKLREETNDVVSSNIILSPGHQTHKFENLRQ